MNKLAIVISGLFLAIGAQAAEVGTNGFFIGAQTGTLHIHDEPSATVSGFHGGYRYYFTDKFSGEVDASILHANTSESDKLRSLSFGVAYDLPLNQNFTFRPKIALGSFQSSFNSGSSQGAMSKVGFELAYKQNFSVEVAFDHYKSGSNAGAHSTNVGLNYKF